MGLREKKRTQELRIVISFPSYSFWRRRSKGKWIADNWTDTSCIFERFTRSSCTQALVSSYTSHQNVNVSRNLFFLGGRNSLNTHLSFPTHMSDIFRPTTATTAYRVGWPWWILGNCSCRPEVLDQAYLITHNLLDEMLNHVNSCMFRLLFVPVIIWLKYYSTPNTNSEIRTIYPWM